MGHLLSVEGAVSEGIPPLLRWTFFLIEKTIEKLLMGKPRDDGRG